jgi:hypothetical protein
MMHSEASRAIWDWRNKGARREARPSRGAAFIGLAVGSVVAAILFWYGHLVMMAVVLTISLGMFTCALFIPKAYQVIQAFLQKFSHAVGQVLTWVLLIPFFYMGFSLGRLVQKLARRDPMTRGWRPEQASYWVDRQAETDKEQYKRQF